MTGGSSTQKIAFLPTVGGYLIVVEAVKTARSPDCTVSKGNVMV